MVLKISEITNPTLRQIAIESNSDDNLQELSAEEFQVFEQKAKKVVEDGVCTQAELDSELAKYEQQIESINNEIQEGHEIAFQQNKKAQTSSLGHILRGQDLSVDDSTKRLGYFGGTGGVIGFILGIIAGKKSGYSFLKSTPVGISLGFGGAIAGAYLSAITETRTVSIGCK